MVAALVALEGGCGGLAYVNTFYHISLLPSASVQEREFKIGSIGFSDSLGILLASLLSVPVEVGLCKVQVGRGREFCTEL